MANVRKNVAYGLNNPLQDLAPQPIVSQRAPTANDFAEIGTTWVDVPNQSVYVLAAIVGNAAVWTTSPASGVGLFASVTVNPGDVDVTAGDVNIAAGNLNLLAGNAVIAGDLTVNGVTTINGDFDLTSTALIDFTSTLNAAPSILLNANGGAAESIEIRSTQGTTASSININSIAGGVTIDGGLATADAINLVASNAAGGIDIDAGTGGIAIDSTGAFSIDGAAASNITTTGAGVDLTLSSVLGSVLIESTENAANAIRLHANGGVNETIQIHSDLGTAVNSIDILSDVGGITLTATGLASADAINLNAVAGGVDIDGALQVNIASSQAAVANSVRIVASAADGGIDIDAGTGGITIDSTGAISIDGAAASNVTVTGAGADLTLSSVGGSVAIASNEAVATAISLNASDAAGGIAVDYGTGGMAVTGVNGAFTLATGTGAVSISADAAATTVSVGTGAGIKNVTIGSTNTTSVTTIQGGTVGINLNAAGQLNAQVATDTIASPGTTATIDASLGKATFTGFTTAAGAAQVFTITNAVVTATSTILCSATNLGANDAQMTVTRILPGAGTFDVTLTNNGSAALNGNVAISFWIPA